MVGEDGKLTRVIEFMPFSIDKRQCPGEVPARTELFPFPAHIFNAFKLAVGNTPPSMKSTYGICVM